MAKLDRRIPTDWGHVDKHPYAVAKTVTDVNRILSLPYWHWTHDQGSEGSCVGHGTVMERAITNTRQNILSKLPWPTVRRYDPITLWNAAKVIDEWADTNPGDSSGTSVRAAYDVARTQGLARVKSMELRQGIPTPVNLRTSDLAEGVQSNVWATTTDEIRTAISNGTPVTIGINWYANFDNPVSQANDFWIGSGDLGTVRGGHCVCLYGASDKLQAFKMKNSWGRSYPLVWLPYATMQRLLDEQGEAALVQDK